MEINTGNTIGIKRHIDELGRIVVPKEFRKDLCITTEDMLEIFEVKDGIYIKKINN